MKPTDKVIYNSISGSVTAVVVATSAVDYGGDLFKLERLTLRSTSRTNRSYPAGYQWNVPAGSASVVRRP